MGDVMKQEQINSTAFQIAQLQTGLRLAFSPLLPLILRLG